ncbi:MAG: helix-turn-helix transcriptional regulator [Planctomycetes bacterium]|nr:helix-turn-helix transcriptional regulator [Planctomycetota bacterium]
MPRIRYAGHPARHLRSLPVHHHDVWIVIVYTYGKGAVLFADETISFQRGTVLCVPPRMPYAEKSSWGFKSAFIAAEDLAMDTSRPHLFKDEEGILLRLAPLVVDAYNCGSKRTSIIAEQLFGTLLLGLTPVEGMKRHPMVERLRELVHRHWSDPDFHVGKGFNALPVSQAHLRRAFVQECKMPPVGYLLRYRLNQALRLLSIGGFSIKEVSQMCGFADPYYFSRAFRKIVGKPPSTLNRK